MKNQFIFHATNMDSRGMIDLNLMNSFTGDTADFQSTSPFDNKRYTSLMGDFGHDSLITPEISGQITTNIDNVIHDRNYIVNDSHEEARLKAAMFREHERRLNVIEDQADQDSRAIAAEYESKLKQIQKVWSSTQEDAIAVLAAKISSQTPNDAYSSDLAQSMSVYVKQVEDLLSAHHERQVSAWEKEQEKLLDRCRKLDEHSFKTEESARMKCQKALEDAALQHEAAKKELIRQWESKVEERSMVLVEERKLLEKQRIEAERTLKSHYAELLAQMSVEREDLERARVESLAHNLEIKIVLEKEKADAYLAVVSEAETTLHSRFQKLMDNAKLKWDSIRSRREKELETRLVSLFEEVTNGLNSQLEVVLANQTAVEDRWQSKIRLLSEVGVAKLNELEEVQSRRTELQIMQQKKDHEKIIAQLKSQHALDEAKWAKEKASLEREKRRMRLSLLSWKEDYLRAAEAQSQAAKNRQEESIMRDVGVVSSEVARLGYSHETVNFKILGCMLRKLWNATGDDDHSSWSFLENLENILVTTGSNSNTDRQLKTVYESEMKRLRKKLGVVKIVGQWIVGEADQQVAQRALHDWEQETADMQGVLVREKRWRSFDLTEERRQTL